MRPPIDDLLKASADLEPLERLPWLTAAIDCIAAEQTLLMMEAGQFFFGTVGQATRFVTEDPRFDDGEFWDEVGIGFSRRGIGLHPRDSQDLDSARRIGRFLAQNNGFAMGAHQARMSYIVGTGLNWRLVPLNPDAEDKELTARGQRAIDEFVELNEWGRASRENVRMADRDGEYFIWLFPNAGGPLQVREILPEHVQDPPAADRGDGVEMGIELAPHDAQRVLAYHVADGKGHIQRVPARTDLGFPSLPLPIPTIVHHKVNVDRRSRRGWPTLWGVRRNLFRAQKLMRNAGNVAALQNAIALIRTHETSTAAQIDAYVQQNSSALLINNATGRETRLQDVPPLGTGGGTIIDKGPGVKYEAPINSINGAAVREIVQMELREVAARLQMSESMFTADASNANFASSLVAEGPAVKNFEAEQIDFGASERKIIDAALKNEIAFGRLSPRILTEYELQARFPSLITRDRLAEAQTNQVYFDMGVKSRTTIQLEVDLDPETEERNFDREEPQGEGLMEPTDRTGMPAVLGAEKKEPISHDAPAPEPAPETAGPEFAELALNGAQVQALLQIVQLVVEKAMPPETAKRIIQAAFPQLDPATIDRIVNPVATFIPAVVPVNGGGGNGS